MISELIAKIKSFNDRQEIEYWALLREVVAKGNPADSELQNLLDSGRAFGYPAPMVKRHIEDMASVLEHEQELEYLKNEWPKEFNKAVKELAEAKDQLTAAKKRVVELETQVQTLTAKVTAPRYGQDKSEQVNIWLGEYRRKYPLAFTK